MTHPEDSAGLPHPDGVTPNGVTPNEAPGGAPDAAPDVPLDAALRAAARHYHVPPPVPAEAMWAAVQARRAQTRRAAPSHDLPLAGAAPPAEASSVRIAHPPRGRARSASRWVPLAAAAVLLLGVGIGVGRYTAFPEHAAGGTSGRPTPAGDGPRGGALVARGTGGAADPARAAAVTAVRAHGVPTAGGSRVPVAVAAAPVATRRATADDRTTPAVEPSAEASTPLRAATDQHLARAEALLTTFAAHDVGGVARDGRAGDTPDAAWARDLLTTTRLLLDSPAGREPARRALLEDLELVLGQIARLPRADTPDERALIDRAIRRGDLMAKLRTAVPAGAATPTPARGT